MYAVPCIVRPGRAGDAADSVWHAEFLDSPVDFDIVPTGPLARRGGLSMETCRMDWGRLERGVLGGTYTWRRYEHG